MKCIATMHDDAGRLIGIVDGPDATNQHVTVKGKKWRFDFDEYCGPLWLRSDGWTSRKNQNPPKAVWNAFSRWLKRYQGDKPSPKPNMTLE